MRKILLLITVIIFLLVAAIIYYYKPFAVRPEEKGELIKDFNFSTPNALTEWDEKVLNGRVLYQIESSGKGRFVQADSAKSASALYYKIKIDVNRRPVIRWRWKANKFPIKKMAEALSVKREEDFAARIYVLFPAAFFTNSKAIEYIWAETLPVGTSGSSAYSKNIKVMVLRSGDGESGWVSEERDIYDDYVYLFGEKPTLDVGAISFMTDADSTRTEASASYSDIRLFYGQKKE